MSGSCFESRELDGGVLEHAEEDLASLVDPEEALAGILHDLRGESLSMLDESLFDDFEHLIGAAAHVCQVIENLCQLKQIKIPVKALINKLLLDQLPELVVLKGHCRGTLDEMDQRLGAVAVKLGELSLHGGQNEVPELRRSLKLVFADHPEGVSHLEISKMSTVLSEDEGEGIGRLASTQGEVNLMEDVRPAVVEVVVSSSVDPPSLHGN